MKINQLEILCRIIELGSFSKAADSLHLSQPTLTEHIKSLEVSLGTTLLDRLGREVTPTKAGEILYDYSLKILRLADEAEQKIESLHGELKGDLTIGASTIPGEFILPQLIKLFREDHPRIFINLGISDSKSITHAVAENRLELGVVGTKLESTKLEYHQFLSDELILVAPAVFPLLQGKAISVNTIKEIPFILREEGSATRLTMEKALRAKGLERLELNVVAILGSTTAVIQGIKGGLGCSVISRRAVREELEAGTVKEISIKGVTITRNFYLVLRRGKARSPLSEALLAFLQDYAATRNMPPL